MARTKDGGAIVHVSPTTAGVMYNEIPLDDWDDDELIKGKRKDRDGKFRGRPPKLVPSNLHRELTRRRFSRAYDLLTDSLVDAAQMLRSIVNDPETDAGDRIRAAEVIFDRILGRPKEQVAIDFQSDGGSRFQQLLMKAIVGTEEQAQALVEGEIVEDD
jgi:hypothetical protein